ncbi:hypothetical protein MtrunA17_Chr3g0135131 [Medicago truncatula]|uniref:Transmembrane protein n=1 Tax=Medicago truncatula TaxID=3880 RepID=A0A396IY38_MEDTR|nr:hypothetical protein MtrunA17_Chr3g0135131 [Medicago truncatula]
MMKQLRESRPKSNITNIKIKRVYKGLLKNVTPKSKTKLRASRQKQARGRGRSRKESHCLSSALHLLLLLMATLLFQV